MPCARGGAAAGRWPAAGCGYGARTGRRLGFDRDQARARAPHLRVDVPERLQQRHHHAVPQLLLAAVAVQLGAQISLFAVLDHQVLVRDVLEQGMAADDMPVQRALVQPRLQLDLRRKVGVSRRHGQCESCGARPPAAAGPPTCAWSCRGARSLSRHLTTTRSAVDLIVARYTQHPSAGVVSGRCSWKSSSKLQRRGARLSRPAGGACVRGFVTTPGGRLTWCREHAHGFPAGSLRPARGLSSRGGHQRAWKGRGRVKI
jgi:hypothetical protein